MYLYIENRMKSKQNFSSFKLCLPPELVFIQFGVLNFRYLLACLCRTDSNGITCVVLLVPNVT